MKVVSLAEVTERVQTWTPARSPEMRFDYLDLSSVDNRTKRVTTSVRLAGSEAPSRARQLVREGDVLVSTVRPNLNAVAVIDDDLNGATASTGFTVLRPKANLDTRYLFHWVRSTSFIRDMVRKATGASYPAVSDRIVKESVLPLPSLDEQRRIADILDCADALHAKQRQVVTHLDDLAQSIFTEMFSDEPAQSFRPVSEVCDRITVGVVIKPASHYVETGVPALRTLNVKPGWIDRAELVYFSEESNDGPLAKSKLRTGDVVVSRTGRAGVAAVVPPSLDGANAIDLIVVSPTSGSLDSLYFEALLNSQFGARLVAGEQRGQIQQHFNVGSLKSAEIPVPSPSRQKCFADKLRHIRGLQVQVSDVLADLDELFASLQSRAFYGKL